MKPTEQHVPSGQQAWFKIPHVVQSHARFLLWFTWDDLINEESPTALGLILRGFPRDQWLNVSSEGQKGKPSTQNLLVNF